MKIIDKYLFKKIAPMFFYILFVFSLFVFIGDFFEKMSLFSKTKTEFLLILKYVLCETPFYFSMLLPLSILTASFFLLQSLRSTGQWKAFIASGYSPLQIIKPLIYFSILVVFLGFLYNEFVASPLYLLSKKIESLEIKKHKNWIASFVKNISFKSGDFFINSSKYLEEEKEFEDFFAQKNSNNSKDFNIIYAKKAKWQEKDKNWVLNNGGEIYFDNGKEKKYFFDEAQINILPEPEYLFITEFDPIYANFFSLKERIFKMNKMGLNTKSDYSELLAKIAWPLVNPLMVLLALSIFVLDFPFNKTLGMVLSLLSVFVFWNVYLIFRKLSEMETISFFMGAFGAHILLLSLLIIVLKKQKVI